MDGLKFFVLFFIYTRLCSGMEKWKPPKREKRENAGKLRKNERNGLGTGTVGRANLAWAFRAAR